MGILPELFFSFARIGAFTFGGGYAMLSLLEHGCVEKKQWLTADEMAEATVIAESAPGPIVVNAATMTGFGQAGIIGAAVATLGVILPSFLIMLVIPRLHMLTAAAILEADWRTASLDYHTLMKMTAILSRSNEEDLLQMFRRMCFNVYAHNRDDHLKNFTWIYDPRYDCWHPSPAYDLTWSTTYFGEHTITVDGNGRDPGEKELTAVGKKAGLPLKTCRQIIEEVRERTESLEARFRNTRS